MSVSYDRTEHSPYGRVTQPVVSGRLWRGVVVGLLLEAAVIAPLVVWWWR